MSGDRIPVPAKMRFEVFKRDKFTCQYCGARAPEVVLHADHINPVAEGGETTLINLITSCQKCNGGKGARPLSSTQEIDKQHDLLAQLEERRQQLEWMVLWRDELQNLKYDTVQKLVDKIVQRSSLEPNEAGRADLTRWLKRFEFDLLLRAIDESFDTYAQYERDAITAVSWNKAFAKIPAVADILAQEEERPYLRRLIYIQGIIRKRSGAKYYKCIDYLEHVHLCGVTIDDLERRAKQMSSLEDFEKPIDDWLKSIGRPY